MDNPLSINSSKSDGYPWTMDVGPYLDVAGQLGVRTESPFDLREDVIKC